MKTLRKQLDDILQENRANADLDLAHIAKQMDALLEECAWYLGGSSKKILKKFHQGETPFLDKLEEKLKQAGYGV